MIKKTDIVCARRKMLHGVEVTSSLRLEDRTITRSHSRNNYGIYMTTEKELRQLLKDNPPAKKFVPYCYLNQEADALTAYFEGDADYSELLNDHVTLYHSLETKEIVGCRVKGISSLIADLPNYIRVNDGEVELSVLLFAYRGCAEGEERKTMNDLARASHEKKMTLQTR